MIVINHRPRITTVGSIDLLPGANEVDGAAFKEASKPDIVQRWISEGALEVINDSPKAKPAKSDDAEQAATEVKSKSKR